MVMWSELSRLDRMADQQGTKEMKYLRRKNNMNVNGKIKLYAKKAKDGSRWDYFTQIGKKQSDGSWVNSFLNITLCKDAKDAITSLTWSKTKSGSMVSTVLIEGFLSPQRDGRVCIMVTALEELRQMSVEAGDLPE